MAIHWCEAWQPSPQGAGRLAEGGQQVTVWRPDPDPSGSVLLPAGLARAFSPDALRPEVQPGDVIVSHLPVGDQVNLALICIERHAHFVSSQPVSPGLLGLDGAFRAAGLVSLNGVGFIPGLDHLMAHDLVARYRASEGYSVSSALSLLSCGGEVPRSPDAFRQKFAAPPVADLVALASPSSSVRTFTALHVTHPADATLRYDAPLPVPETFEVHPVGDSLAMRDEFRFDPSWPVRDLLRGRIRLVGWSEAWAPVLDALAAVPGTGCDRFANLAETLWRDHRYGSEEPDRALLFVSLKAERDGRITFHETWALDAWGDARGPAMTRLESGLLALAAEAVLAREIPVGVHSAPHDPRLVARWLGEAEHVAQHLARVRHHPG